MTSLNYIRLRHNSYTKLLAHIRHDGIGKRGNFNARCATTIDEHEGLLFIHACSAERFALPSALLNEPPCGDFYALCLGVVGHVGVGGFEALKFSLAYVFTVCDILVSVDNLVSNSSCNKVVLEGKRSTSKDGEII